ncbi:hypothetical protein [Nocardia sp. NPDC051981]|uniref:hypothetical protein n=1 Tax=Nocardia sp. NPDC051981 TaxID=3155417 RepID=UPI0034459953
MGARIGVADSMADYGDILTPDNVAQFLASRHWTKQVDRTFDQVWVLDGGHGGRSISVLLPREPSFVDYAKRLREAVTAISGTYDLAMSELAEQVASVHADLFFVRVDQTMRDGTIPLRQAASLLDNIGQLIRAAAVATHNPQASGRGRVPDYVNEFLNDDIRMGHTKKGSFIITVAARLDDAAVEALSADRPEDSDNEGMPSFTRRVMTTLARSLEVTRRFAADRGDFTDVDDAVNQGLKLPVVQALQEMGAAEGLHGLDLSFEWAAAEPQNAPVPSHVSLDRAIIDELPEIESRLVRREEPQRVTVVGPVIELKVADDGAGTEEDQGGAIVINADIGRRTRKVTIPLEAEDFRWAIAALRDKLPFAATGDLAKKGNSWWLNEPIEVDRSFLEFRLHQL